MFVKIIVVVHMYCLSTFRCFKASFQCFCRCVLSVSHHGRGGAVLPGLCEDVPARLSVSAVQHQRAAFVVQLGRWRCVCDRLCPAASLTPAPGPHHSAGPHTGRPKSNLHPKTLVTLFPVQVAGNHHQIPAARFQNLVESPHK